MLSAPESRRREHHNSSPNPKHAVTGQSPPATSSPAHVGSVPRAARLSGERGPWHSLSQRTPCPSPPLRAVLGRERGQRRLPARADISRMPFCFPEQPRVLCHLINVKTKRREASWNQRQRWGCFLGKQKPRGGAMRPGRCSGLEGLPADRAPVPGDSFGGSPGCAAGRAQPRHPNPPVQPRWLRARTVALAGHWAGGPRWLPGLRVGVAVMEKAQ